MRKLFVLAELLVLSLVLSGCEMPLTTGDYVRVKNQPNPTKLLIVGTTSDGKYITTYWTDHENRYVNIWSTAELERWPAEKTPAEAEKKEP